MVEVCVRSATGMLLKTKSPLEAIDCLNATTDTGRVEVKVRAPRVPVAALKGSSDMNRAVCWFAPIVNEPEATSGGSWRESEKTKSIRTSALLGLTIATPVLRILVVNVTNTRPDLKMGAAATPVSVKSSPSEFRKPNIPRPDGVVLPGSGWMRV